MVPLEIASETQRAWAQKPTLTISDIQDYLGCSKPTARSIMAVIGHQLPSFSGIDEVGRGKLICVTTDFFNWLQAQPADRHVPAKRPKKMKKSEAK